MIITCSNCGKQNDYELPPGQEFSCSCGAKLYMPDSEFEELENEFTIPFLCMMYAFLGAILFLLASLHLYFNHAHVDVLTQFISLLFIAFVMLALSSVIYYLAKIEFNTRKKR